MSENELLQKWTATKDQQFLSQLLEQLYELGHKKLSDKVSRDVLHNAILKIHARLKQECNIREIKSFFLKTLYNGLMDYYKKEQAHSYIPIVEDHLEEEVKTYSVERIDLEQLIKLEQLLSAKQLKRSRVKFLNAVLFEDEKQFSRQNKFFHRNELKKTISLLDINAVSQFFTYTRRELKEDEDLQQVCEVQKLYQNAKSYKRKALGFSNENSCDEYSELEVKLLKLFNMTIALNLYKQASALNPEYFKPRFNVGFCYFKLNKYEEAIKEFKATLFYLNEDQQQSNYDIKMGSTLRNLGTIYMINLNQYHKALRCFNEALKYTPLDEKVRLGIIFSACRLNDNRAALEQLRSFNRPADLANSITNWTNDDDKIKKLAINIYKESSAVRAHIPIEKII